MLEGIEPPKNKSIFCKVDLVLQDLDGSDKAILIEALADKDKWGARPLSNALRARGVSLADTTIGKHRNKNCSCFRG